jgi:thiosulfate/3-mercaptopyruvate sulfurtransferase
LTDRGHWFVSTDWLVEHLSDPDVVVVDGTWHLATTGRRGLVEYRAAHVPGAVFFDIDAIADTVDPLPHMLPTAEKFAAAVGPLGIDEKQKVVVYDGVGLSSAPRVWWTFKVMGAQDAVILDGGLPKWRSEGRPVESGAFTRPPRAFSATFDPAVVRDLEQVRAGLASGAFQLIDARPSARFLGEAPEPRPWVKTGRIPGSHNVPSSDLVADGRLKDADALRRLFNAAGVDLTRPIVTSCGSGVNATTLTLALDVLGVKNTAVYDGSWTEWGARDDTPIAVGPDETRRF